MPIASRTTEYERILEENERYAAQFDRSKLAMPPSRHLAVIACMDARFNVPEALALRAGDAHIIRNAGGLATDDAIRSLVISRQLLGTDEVLVIGHTDCGMLTFDDQTVRGDLAAKTGADVELPLLPFANVEDSVRNQVDRIRSHPWTKDVPVHGLIFEVATGRLHEIV